MRRTTHVLLLALLALSIGGCDLVGDLFELAFWTVAIVFILILAIIWWGVSKLRGGSRRPPPGPPPV